MFCVVVIAVCFANLHFSLCCVAIHFQPVFLVCFVAIHLRRIFTNLFYCGLTAHFFECVVLLFICSAFFFTCCVVALQCVFSMLHKYCEIDDFSIICLCLVFSHVPLDVFTPKLALLHLFWLLSLHVLICLAPQRQLDVVFCLKREHPRGH